jgi:hypothetical protein
MTSPARPRLAVHAHFYQPDRRDPFTGEVPPDPSAAPAHDWTDRVTDECYAPNALRGNFRHIGWDLGPALALWLQQHRPDVYASIAEQDDGSNAMALPWHHIILPLAPTRDRRTEIRWGIRDFELRYGHRPAGIWLPEAAVDLLTLRLCAEEGIRYTILAPWQAGTDGDLDTRRPYRVEVGGGHSMVVMFYDRDLSTAVSFDPGATQNADDFVRSRVLPRLAEPLPSGEPPLALIATDGELYGHHQGFRELFLARLTTWYGSDVGDPSLEVVTLGAALAEASRPALPIMTIRERTSWSCLHGVLRWSAECPDAADGRWKQPLRLALDRLAAAIDTLTDTLLRPTGVDPWQARDGYADVAAGYVPASEYVQRVVAEAALPTHGADAPSPRTRRAHEALLQDLLSAQSSRLAMFASDAWFWDDPTRPETLQVLRFAAHAARTLDHLTDAGLERSLVEDLRALRSPSTGVDGAGLYRLALEQVHQLPPE